MTDVTYSIHDDDRTLVAGNQLILLPPWAGIAQNAEGVAQEICEEHFDERTWGEHFLDSNHERVAVEIHAPAEVAGFYRVEIRRVPRAKAVRMTDAEARAAVPKSPAAA